MKDMIKTDREGYREFWFDLNQATSIGLGNVAAATPMGNTTVTMTVVVLMSGERIVLPMDQYQPLLAAMTGKEMDDQGVEDSGPVPSSFYGAWEDQKGDDDDEGEQVDV